ncbi:MAG: hypothetical protein ACTSXW_03725, partial [Candidatus Baldrarchaeia archaeon]
MLRVVVEDLEQFKEIIRNYVDGRKCVFSVRENDGRVKYAFPCIINNVPVLVEYETSGYIKLEDVLEVKGLPMKLFSVDVVKVKRIEK